VIDLGADVAPEKFVQAAKDTQAQIVGISTLLTTTMLGMKDVLHALERADLRKKVKVMVGGAPVTQSFANEIGADGYGESAAEAVDKAKELLGIK
jgi:5-methyltetrahydrofolate--homocysteine methyltransferase